MHAEAYHGQRARGQSKEPVIFLEDAEVSEKGNGLKIISDF